MDKKKVKTEGSSLLLVYWCLLFFGRNLDASQPSDTRDYLRLYPCHEYAYIIEGAVVLVVKL